MTTATRSRVTAALLLLLVAGAGFAAGVATERVRRAQSEVAALSPQAPPFEGLRILHRDGDTTGGVRLRMFLPDRLAEELDLTPGQRVEIERIIREDQAAIRRITGGMEPELRAIVENSRRRIHEVLTEEQIARWHEMPLVRLRRPDAASQPRD